MNRTIIPLAALIINSLPCYATTVVVHAIDNIYGAGHGTPPGPGGGSSGNLPPGIILPVAPGRVLTFSSVTGTATLTTSFGLFSPDGNPSFAMNLSSYGGISGIKSDASSCLVGVFLASGEPVDPAPTIPDFTAAGLGTTFSTLAPLINQMFYIGDGLTGTGSGSQQQFYIPDTATAFYLGFADGNGYSGLPGMYGDNDGALIATFDVVPEPNAVVLFIAGCLAICSMRRRKHT